MIEIGLKKKNRLKQNPAVGAYKNDKLHFFLMSFIQMTGFNDPVESGPEEHGACSD